MPITCKTKAEDDNDRAAPMTMASSTLLILTCNSVQKKCILQQQPTRIKVSIISLMEVILANSHAHRYFPVSHLMFFHIYSHNLIHATQ